MNYKEAESDVSNSISGIFERITMRLPSENELSSLKELYDSSLIDFQENKKKAIELLSIGEYEIEEQEKSAHLAALTTIVLTVFNLDESISLS
jgi:hypothetical protein